MGNSVSSFSSFSFIPPDMRPLSRDKADTLLLLAACIAVMVPHAAHLPGWSTAACMLLLSWRAWITFRGNRMPPRWLLLPIAAIAIAGVYWSYKTLLGREPGVTLLVLLLALKLLEMRAKRDLFVVIFLSFFLILAQFFYSQSIVSAIVMLAAALLLLTAQLSFQYTGARPSLGRRLLLCAKIFMLALPLMLVLFILFPRIEGPLWKMPGDAQSGKSGLSDNMSPGNISRLALSGAIAFRAKFTDTPPPQSMLYWRGPVLGQFDGRTWTPVRQSLARPAAIKPRGAAIRYQVTMEPSGQHALFVLELPKDLPHITGNPSVLTPDLQILAQKPINERIRYEASSFVESELLSDETPQSLRKWLQLPPGFNPESIAYAKRLRSQVQDDMGMVNAVLQFFRNEKFSYTLEPPALGRNTVDEFLFSTRAGFCEHYSSAFVVLMRAAGIPARVVTGYQGGEVNAVDGFMEIRQSDAHAWSEVWLQNRGWVRVDPTSAVAPDRINRNLPAAIPQPYFGGLLSLDENKAGAWIAGLRKLRHNWDALNNAWNQRVLDYSFAKQKSLLESLGFSNAGWQTLSALLLGVGSLVMLAISLPMIRNRVKPDPVEALYDTLCKRMARYGCPRALHEGPRAYRARLTASDSTVEPDKQKSAAHFLELYESIRYGKESAQYGKVKKNAIIIQLKSYLAQCR